MISASLPLPEEESVAAPSTRVTRVEPPTRTLPAGQLQEIIASLPLPVEPVPSAPPTRVLPAGQLHEINASRPLPTPPKVQSLGPAPAPFQWTAPPQSARPESTPGRPAPAAGALRPVLQRLGSAGLPMSVGAEALSWSLDDGFPFLAAAGASLVLMILGSAKPPSQKTPPATPPPAAAAPAAKVLPMVVGTWEQAEISAMLHMRAHGYPDARRTPPGPDGGVDVVSRHAIAQVKHYGKPIGAPDITRLGGTAMLHAHRGKTALFYSSRGFTPKAVAAARELGMELYVLQGGRYWHRVR